MSRARLPAACFCAVLGLCPILLARHSGSPRKPALDNVTLRADSSLVIIPAHVTTPAGAPVTTLRKEDFRLTENDIEQTITDFSQDDAPVSIGFLFDSSGSMRTKMNKAWEAAAAFFKTTNPEDEFFLVRFSDRATLSVPYTADSDEVLDKIRHIRPFGRTALLDAVHLGLGQLKKAHNQRKALVILSDGGDNWSRHTAGEVRKTLLESDVQVYAMGIFDPALSDAETIEELHGPQLLDELAEQSGGRNYPVKKLADLPAISMKIGNELRSQYLLGYYPTDLTRDGKFHPVKISVKASNGTGLRTYHRRGYYSPSE